MAGLKHCRMARMTPTLPDRRQTLALLLSGALGNGLAQAQTQPGWPAKPVKLIVPFAPGGPAELCHARQWHRHPPGR